MGISSASSLFFGLCELILIKAIVAMHLGLECANTVQYAEHRRLEFPDDESDAALTDSEIENSEAD